MMEKTNVAEAYATEPDSFFRRKSELCSSSAFFLSDLSQKMSARN